MSHTLSLSGSDFSVFVEWWLAHRMPVDDAVRHFVWQTDELPCWDAVAYTVSAYPDTEALLAQLQAHWWGLIPGWHRLPLEKERLVLHLAIMRPMDALEACTGVMQDIHLHAAAFLSPSSMECTRLSAALTPLCRHGTRLRCQWTVDTPSEHQQAWQHALRSKGWQLSDNAKSRQQTFIYDPHWIKEKPRSSISDKYALVIGAGLSGAACAWSLAQRGWDVTVLDAQEAPAGGASGLPVGLVVPHLSADDTRISQVSRAGVRCMLHRAHALLTLGEDWQPSGVLEHCVDGGSKLPHTWTPQASSPALAGSADWSHAATATDITQAHLPPAATAIAHPCAAWIKPPALVRTLLKHPHIRFAGHASIHSLQRDADGRWHALDAQGQTLVQADIAVLAAAYNSRALLQPLSHATEPRQTAPFGVALNPLRGQVAWGWQDDLADADDKLPSRPVNGKGSMAAHIPYAQGGRSGPMWITGSTFTRGDTDASPRAADVPEILAKLHVLHPAAAQALTPAFAAEQVQSWAGVRATLPDRLPAVGSLGTPGTDGLYLCCGMGARGLALAMLCGELLAAEIHEEPWPLERKLGQMLSARRWLKRAT